jgi:lysophospholipase
VLTHHDLPPCNHDRQARIIEAGIANTAGRRFDCRRIPEAAVESWWEAGDGHRIRRIDWPEPEGAVRGSLLFLPGRGDSYEKYLETLHHWHERGWRVGAADWRGQGGSGRFGNDPYTGHIDDFALWVEDLARFWNLWQAAGPGPHVLIGHSMGGHLALRAVAEKRIDPAALVLVAPMLGFTKRLPLRILHRVARLMVRWRDPRRPAWRWSEKPGSKLSFRADLLTHDADRYADELWWRAKRPEISMGPGSWGWIERACQSMRALLRRGVLESVATPVLALATTHDALVGFNPIRRAVRRMPRAELARFGPEARHEILREVDPVRDKALALIDDFLARAAPASPRR